MQNKLNELINTARAEIAQAVNPNDILNLKAQFLGKKSVLNTLYTELKTLSPEERPAFGQKLNAARVQIEAFLESQEKALKAQAWEQKNQAAGMDLRCGI